MPDFLLHPQLEKDSALVTEIGDLQVRLRNDSRYIWLIVVPMQPDLVEIFDVPEQDRSFVWKNIHKISMKLKFFTKADKMNIAALGNMVPQLHIHIIARYKDDFAWPKPVWGQGDAVPYDEKKLISLVDELRQLLDKDA